MPPEKLNWLNRHYLKQADPERELELATRVFQEAGLAPESLDEPSATGEARVASLKADEPGNLERLLDRERRGFLERKLQELPAIYREAVSLRFEEEMTFEEMALVLQAPVSTVKSRVQRALSSLRKSLAP
jgi:RNA polymerase sigma-70 factor (ECF subfamily)